jgi:lipopolysaccharide transport system ATP-binding protein
MSSDVSVRIDRLSKAYRVYAKPVDRLKQALWRGRRRYYREFWALRDLSLDVMRGETIGVVGRNGSGKTTLLQLIGGALSPTGGGVEVAGRLSMLLSLGAGFDPLLTGRENVRMNAAVVGLSRKQVEERSEAIWDFSEIGDFVDEPVHTYSAGMYMRLAFALAIHVEPDVLLIDEVLAVGDEAFQRKCFARLQNLRDRGVTIVFVSHSATSILELCDRALLLDGGERLLLGPPKGVIARYHRLIFAPPDEAETVRDEIRRLDSRGEVAASAPEPTQGPELVETVEFDPSLSSRSTVNYVPRGAKIRNVRIENEEGATANVLRRGGSYYCAYEVEFLEAAHGVRFGMMIKSLAGFELGGVASHPESGGVPFVEAGSRWTIRIPFRVRLLSGTYFINAGLMGIVEGAPLFLHRVLDAVMFRVALEKNLAISEIVDFSSTEPAQIEPVTRAAPSADTEEDCA